MTKIAPFYGLRYNLQKIRDIHKVVAPPYDVISDKAQAELYKQHPLNVVRLILGKIYKEDTSENNRYTRAGKLLKQWMEDKILVFDTKPSLYLYAQDFSMDGKKMSRIGFISRLEIGGKGCLPHEHTLAKPKEDRLMLFRQVRANLSPIFSFYYDKKNSVENLLKKFMRYSPCIEFTDKEDVRHRFWQISEEEVIEKVQKLMMDKPIFIADGHHRYEVAKMYREEALKRGGIFEEGANYVMMFFTGFNEKNLCILPTHRMVKGFKGIEEKINEIDVYFSRIELASLRKLNAAQRKEKGICFGMCYGGKFYLLKAKNRPAIARIMKKAPLLWRNLDVAILNNVVFEHIFGLDKNKKEENIVYTRDMDFAAKSVKNGDCAVAFLLNQTKPQVVRKIALSGEKMPQKSTYFYPKPITGLVMSKF